MGAYSQLRQLHHRQPTPGFFPPRAGGFQQRGGHRGVSQGSHQNAPVPNQQQTAYCGADVTSQNAGLAIRNADVANQNAGLAIRNADVANQNAGQAFRNADGANQNAGLAIRNADVASQNAEEVKKHKSVTDPAFIPLQVS